MTLIHEPDLGTPAVANDHDVTLTIDGRAVTVPEGTSVLRGLEVLAMNLQTQPTDHVPKADAYAEISRVLPYAIVLGGSERWLHAMVEADNDPGVPDPDDLGWYRAPETWQLSDLPASLDAFITTMEGKLYGRG